MGLYAADQQQRLDNRLEQDGLGIVYNATKLDDLPMPFCMLVLNWFIGAAMFVLERWTFGWHWRVVLQRRGLRWMLPVFEKMK